MWCVSGPSRKATPSLICLAEASQPDLTSPAYSRPSRVPLHSPFMISSRNTFSYLTTHPEITAESLHLPCVLPASYPASCVFVSSLLRSASPCILPRHPAFSCVLLHHLASASCVSCGVVVSRMFHRFPDWNKSIPLPASIFPCVPIIRSPFRDPIDPSILPSIPCVQF